MLSALRLSALFRAHLSDILVVEGEWICLFGTIWPRVLVSVAGIRLVPGSVLGSRLVTVTG